MKARQSTGVREAFLTFFEARGHTRVPSSSVLPHGDPTILFTNAGMNQFKDVFLGHQRRSYLRATSSQKCIRAGGKHNDLDNVGRTARHLTFFEMLGNFSFGDYFKKEAIQWAWELLTGPYGLDPDRLFATVYRQDHEARRLWRSTVGLPEEKIIGLGKKENFWSMGEVGPCGPCSEILFDRGERFSCGPHCGIGRCDCDRYFEVWNLVFMQYEKKADGTVAPLPRPSIDTGMGLERLLMVLGGLDSVYETDLLRPLIDQVADLSGRPYDRGEVGIAHRVIADHIRSLTFAIADGAFPSNEGRGYVVRRILRRAARYGRMLGLGEPFLHRLVDTVLQTMGSAYPELVERAHAVKELIAAEEDRFGATLDQGLQKFEELRGECGRTGKKIIAGTDVFLLHDTYGFPPDLVERMAEEVGLGVDMDGYRQAMEKQRERSRAKTAFEDELTAGLSPEKLPPTEFKGYEATSLQSTIEGLSAGRGEQMVIVLRETPFYAESGGQVGDRGILRGPDWVFAVQDTQRRGEHILHLGRVREGSGRPQKGHTVEACVDKALREATERHHSATHLLHAALRRHLGQHVEQRGSLVAPDRLRFDFTHFSPLSEEDLRTVEFLVNEAVLADLPVEIRHLPFAEALKQGAMALFGEKYGEEVRAVRMGGVSCELCGGTHVARTGQIGVCKILSQGSVAAGIRRIEAVCGLEALRHWHSLWKLLQQASVSLKTTPENLPRKIETLLAQVRSLRRKKAQNLTVSKTGQEEVGSVTFSYRVVPGAEIQDLRALWDRLKGTLQRTVLALFGTNDRRASLLVCLSRDLRGTPGLDCGALARAGGAALGAGGGGRPEMGQAGGKDPQRIPGAVRAIAEELRAWAASAGKNPGGKRP